MGARRDRWLHVRTTEEGYSLFLETAAQLGLSVSEALRQAVSEFVAKHRRKP